MLRDKKIIKKADKYIEETSIVFAMLYFIYQVVGTCCTILYAFLYFSEIFHQKTSLVSFCSSGTYDL